MTLYKYICILSILVLLYSCGDTENLDANYSIKASAKKIVQGGDVSISLKAKKEYPIDSIVYTCLLYTSPSPRDQRGSRMPSSA